MPDPKILLTDYLPPSHEVEEVALSFDLHPSKTRVRSRIVFSKARGGDLRLDGRELTLISATIDAKPISVNPDAEGITLNGDDLPDRFVWEAEVEIDPAANTSLEGLYMSNGMYCTQCEAEGFRKITYYPDRPDVMAPFSVRINGDAPVMLSNGNPVNTGKGWVDWQDPWPKPAYLFALVAGDLLAHKDSFTTASGRKVALNIYVRKPDIDKCAYAMDSLKRSMKWDEQEYGREYDLDLFNIVAVDDFNMGAMENKGLNIFNSSLVLASPQTATDQNYEAIESVIAHEYFHNWTGNRITCRDWFQLCLKEGLTVFRDQQFSSDMRDPTVIRIKDVMALRAAQFPEDAGPLAHPPRPSEYIEINNFYTATVYEKGAEVVGMLRRLVGSSDYRKALDLYFDRHDGQACTIEDWLQVFEDVTGRDLSQFKLWYTSAGTPMVSVAEAWDGKGTYTLTLSQKTPPTPGEAKKAPRLIPVAVGLLNPDGTEAVATRVLELSKPVESFRFKGLNTRPTPSILRGFSAPVRLSHNIDNPTRAFLLAHDTDPFNRWEAGRAYALDLLSRGKADPEFLRAMHRVASDTNLAPAFRALALTLPGEDEIAAHIHASGGTPDPIAINQAVKALNVAMAQEMQADLAALNRDTNETGSYSPDAGAAGKRALRSRALALLTLLDPDATLAQAQFETADNMTDQLSALTRLVAAGKAADALDRFYQQWQHESLVVNKWFSVQAMATPAEQAVGIVADLAKHPAFDWKNPNRFRALIGVFAMGNPAGFHDPSGAGYNLFADWLIRLDPINPQIAARMSSAFKSWKRYSPERQAQMKAALQRVQNTTNLSKNTAEMVGRILRG